MRGYLVSFLALFQLLLSFVICIWCLVVKYFLVAFCFPNISGNGLRYPFPFTIYVWVGFLLLSDTGRQMKTKSQRSGRGRLVACFPSLQSIFFKSFLVIPFLPVSMLSFLFGPVYPWLSFAFFLLFSFIDMVCGASASDLLDVQGRAGVFFLDFCGVSWCTGQFHPG